MEILWIHLINTGKNYLITLIPGVFYTFIVFSFIINVKKLGLGLPFTIAYPAAGVLALAYAIFVVKTGKKNKTRIETTNLE